MHEKRLTVRLESYWNRLKKEADMPDFAQWNPNSIDDIWPNCMVMLAEPTAEAEKVFKYTYVGQKIEGTWGKDIVGQRTSKKTGKVFRGAGISKRVPEVLEVGHPVIDDGKFINEKNKVVKYRGCLLPFSSKQGEVTHIVIGLSWKEFG